MKNAALTLAALTAVVASAAWAATAGLITQASIAGARIGLPATAYRELLGPDAKEEVRLPQNPSYRRLISSDRKIAVWFHKKRGDKAELITTWNRVDRTAAGIGPCSTIARLKAVYGSRLKPAKSETYDGKVFAYHLGNLIFAASGGGGNHPPSKRVTAVGVHARTKAERLAAYTYLTLAANSARC
jgi:hypothetical protein